MTTGIRRARESGHAAYRVRLVGVLVFVLTLGGSALFARRQAEVNRRVLVQNFDSATDKAIGRLQARLRTYEYGLRGARGIVVFAQHPHLTRARYRAYAESRDIDREFPGARGIGIIRRIPPRNTTEFLAAAREDGAPDFQIRQLGQNPGDLFVIQYIEPLARNWAAVGLDIGSETHRREAALDAMQSGQARLSAPITLVQASGKLQRSFLLLLPIYLEGHRTGSREERQAACVGWSYAPLVTDEVLGDFQLGSEFSLALRDTALDGGPFFTSNGAHSPAAAGIERRLPLVVYGRSWEAHLKASPAFVASQHLTSPGGVFAVGVGASLLLGGLSYLFAEGRRRSAQLRAERERRAAIVDSSQDAVIGEALDGTIVEWNRGAELLFGYSCAHALGRKTATLILPHERAQEDADMRESIARGEELPPFDSTRLTADGRLVDVSIAASPLRDGDRCVGLSKTIRDISDAKRAEVAIKQLNANLEALVAERTARLEAALRDNETLLHTLNEHAIVSVTDRRGRIVDVNAHFCRISGYTRDELFGLDHRIVNSGHHGRQFWVNVWRTIGSGTAWRGEVCNRAKDGRIYWVDSIIAPFFGPDGKIEKYVSIRFDITAQKTAEQESMATRAKLLAANERITLATDGAGIGIWELEPASGQITWDVWTSRLYGGSEADESPSYDRWLARIHPDDRVRVEQEVSEALGGDRAFDTDFRVVHPGGEIRYHKSSGKVVFDADTGHSRLIGLSFDITERKQAELRLREASTVLQAVLGAAAEVSLIATDCDLNVTVFNHGAERLLGYRAEEVVGKATPLLIHDRAEVAERARQLSEEVGSEVVGGAVFTHPQILGKPLEWTYVRKDGSSTTVSLVVRPMLGPDGGLLGYLGAARDVAPQKAYESSLKQAMLRAEQASIAKSQFLANMSHEIRTPMNAVIGVSYLLGQTALDSEQSGLLAKIRAASKSLLALLNDILDLSKIEAGELTLERSTFSPREMLNDLQSIYQVQAETKEIKLTFIDDGQLPALVRGDATRLNQIISNLLSNALKFTPKGSITLEVSCCQASSSELCLRFEVRDSGIGIPLDAQERLFAPFVQADESTTRRFGGTGLGLSIVKHLAEMMGGEVGVVSLPGEGSQFWGTVLLEVASSTLRPGGEARSGESSPRAESRLMGAHILVVDDSDINQFVAKRILAEQGASASLASTGHEAVAILRAQPNSFAGVLMDIQMPEMDGYEATRVVREELGLVELPIIALTADARASVRQAALEAGMSDFLVKPFVPAALVECLSRQLNRARDTRPDLARSTSAHPGKAWPEIEGIDTEEAKERLQDDRGLFRQLLERLVAGFDEIGTSTEPEHLEELARSMHKLRGGAGQIGARAIHKLAERIEQACREGDTRRVVAVFPQLEVAMRRLAHDVANLPASETEAIAAGATSSVGDARAVPRLLECLEQQSLEAIALLDQMGASVRRQLGDSAFAELSAHVNNLRFTEAHRILARSGSGLDSVISSDDGHARASI